jgi:hypothetical protein
VICSAVNNVQYRCKIPEVQRCQQTAKFRVNGVPLCGTHVNHPPKQVIVDFDGGIVTTEEIK